MDTTSNFEVKGQLISELKNSNGLTVHTKLHNGEPRLEEILVLVVVTCLRLSIYVFGGFLGDKIFLVWNWYLLFALESKIHYLSRQILMI